MTPQITHRDNFIWLLAALAGLRATLQDLAADGAGRNWSAFANDIVGKGKAAVTPEEIV